MIRNAILGVLALASSGAAQTYELQYAQNPSNAHWYGFSPRTLSWPEAAQSAVDAGGYLAAIGSSAEQTWIQGLVGGSSARYWIGLTDAAVEGTFAWTNGEAVAYTNWAPGEPNGGASDDVVELQAAPSFRWADLSGASATTTRPLVEVESTPRVGWTLPTVVAVGNSPRYPAAGDFDGDGRVDVVVPNATSNNVSVLRNTGGGSLTLWNTFATASGPRSAATGDFDGDGFLDFAITCETATRLSVRFGAGDGSFAGPVEVALAAKPHGIDAADLDGDGRDDLAVTTYDSQDRLYVLTGRADRTFGGPAIHAAGSRPLFVTAGDLDADGDVDLVVANESSNDLSIFRNQGNAAFTASALLARGAGPGRVAILDADANGRADLAVPCAGQNVVRLLFGNASGGFDVGPQLTGGLQPRWTATFDTNGDGALDLVTAAAGSSEFVVQEILPNGFVLPDTLLFAGSGVQAVLGVDVDGDGRKDLVGAGTTTNQVVVVRKLSRDCNGNQRDDDVDIALESSSDCNGNREPDECDLALGTTFDCDANGVVDACEILAAPVLDLDGDGVLDECEVAGTPFCFGDGTGAVCPCDPGQAGQPGSGCSNSIGASARLAAVGNPSVASDSVSLRVSGLLPSAVGLFIQGNSQQTGGTGSAFGDGLLCVNVNVIRLQIRTAVGGAMAFGRDVPGDPAVSVDGLVPALGATRYYQVWYRDAANFCSSSTFNLSNGVRIIWTP